MISDEDLLRAVEDATSAEFVVYGELGREEGSRVALLGLERATSKLVVLIVSTTVGDDGSPELGVDVMTELDARVPDGGTFCVTCGTRLRPWGRFCQNCGTDVSGQGDASGLDASEMRAAVEEAVAEDYHLLGEMRRKEGGGRVFFAREKKTGRIAALRLNRSKTADEYELGETLIVNRPKKAAAASVSVTQMLRRLDAGGIPGTPNPEMRRKSMEGSVGLQSAFENSQRNALDAREAPGATAPKPQAGTSGARSIMRKYRGVLIGLAIVAVLSTLVWAALVL